MRKYRAGRSIVCASVEALEGRRLMSAAAPTGGAYLPAPLLASAEAKQAVTVTLTAAPLSHSGNAELVAKVSAGPLATGTVSFYRNDQLLHTVGVDSQGTARLTHRLPAGTCTLRAIYSGNPAFSTAESSSIEFTAHKMQIGFNYGSRQADGSVKFDFRLTNGVAPTGTLYFINGPGGSKPFAEAAIVDGVATLKSVPPWPPIYLSYYYSGDDNYLPISSGSPVRFIPMPIIDTRPVQIEIKPATEVVREGAAVFNVTLSDPHLESGEWFAGTLYFDVDGKQVKATLPSAEGKATIQLPLTQGRHQITVRFGSEKYSGASGSADPFHASGTGSLTVEVAADPRLPTLFDGNKILSFGPGIPTGTVTYFKNNAVAGTRTLDSAGAVSDVPDHDYAVYSGDQAFRSSRYDKQRFQVITSTPAAPGAPVEIITRIGSIRALEVGKAAKLMAGDLVLAHVDSDGSGLYRFPQVVLPAGQQVDLVYEYRRYGIRDGASGIDYMRHRDLTDTINIQAAGTKAVPSIQATSSSMWWYGGYEVTFHAKVIGRAGEPVPTGTVTLAGHVLTLDAKGEANITFRTTLATAPTELVTYSGDARYEAVSDNQDLRRDEVFNYRGAPQAKLTISQSAVASKLGEPVTLTATLTRNTQDSYQLHFAAPGGTLVFYAGGQEIGRAPVDITDASFTFFGVARLTVALPGGVQTITVKHEHDVWAAGSLGAPLTHTVNVDSLPVDSLPAFDGTLLVQGDLDGDGHIDKIYSRRDGAGLVLRKGGPGAAEVSEAAMLAPKDANWLLKGAADLNGDGKADLIWRNDRTGKASVWFMHGANVRRFGMFNHAPRDTAWTIDRVEDTKGDGHADLIWKNSRTGKAFTWLMRGTRVIGVGA